MIEVIRHPSDYNKMVALARAVDPTQTGLIRRAFEQDLRRRFNELTQVIRRAVVDQDVFGLRPPTVFQMEVPRQGQFIFVRSADKVQGFMGWFREQVDRGILEVREVPVQVGAGVEAAWTNKYVFDSYKRGVIRARYELDKAGYRVPSIETTGGIEISMSTPFHLDRLGLIYSRAYDELRGITAAMDTQISRVLAQGLADGDGPSLLARKLVGTINGVGMGDLALTDTLGRFIPARRRAEVLARTEVIRAHHVATIQEYRNWAVEGVVVQAELRTAGDGRVCERCASLEGQIYTLDEIETIIPVHPQCRCIALPAPVEKSGKPAVAPVAAPAEESKTVWKSEDETHPWKSLHQKYRIKGTGGKRELDMVGNVVGNQIFSRMDDLAAQLESNPRLWCDVNFASSNLVGFSNNAYATYIRFTHRLNVGKKALAITKNQLRYGAWTVGEDFASTIRHEWGHHVYHQTLSRQQQMVWEDFFTKRKFKNAVSEYAATDAGEAFAETFSAYTSPLYKSKPMKKEIVDKLESLIGKRNDL